MSAVYYKPPEISHWLEEGSKTARDAGKEKTKELAKATSHFDIAQSLKAAASAAKGFGKSAMAELAQRKIDEVSYTVYEDAIEAESITGRKRIPFTEITTIIKEKNDRFSVVSEAVTIHIKPIAHLVTSRVRVPIGWNRSGMEVPYGLLIEEISARCGVEITTE